jgi:single-strand DNA-binding protein
MADGDLTISGTLGRDPELQFTGTARAVTRLGVAVSRRWKGQDDKWQEKTTWMNVTVWGDLAENVAASCQKGDRVVCTGYLDPNEWTDKEGNVRKETVMIAQDVAMSLKWATAVAERRERTAPSSQPAYADEDPFA